MAELSATELARMRRKLGDATGAVFSNDELNDIYTEAGADFDRALMIAFEEIMYDAAKFNDYTAGQTSERKSQVFDHLSKVVARIEATRSNKQQVRIVGLRGIPPHVKDEPR
jgi:hypothetical protein